MPSAAAQSSTTNTPIAASIPPPNASWYIETRTAVRYSVVRFSTLFLLTLAVPALGAATFEELAAKAAAARDANQPNEAIQFYRQALHLNPRWPEGWWFLGAFLYEKDQYDD